MPIKLFHLENGGVLAQCRGIVTGSEVIEASDQLYETDEKIRKISYQIFDFTKLEKLLVSDTEIDLISSQDIKAFEINPSILIAIVSSESFIYGLARMWEIKTYDPAFETKVFRKLELAQEWIDKHLAGL